MTDTDDQRILYLASDYHAQVRSFGTRVLPRADEPTIGGLTAAILSAIDIWIAGQRDMRNRYRHASGCTRVTDGCDWPDCPCGSLP